jgi:nitric oxide reductase activation protein
MKRATKKLDDIKADFGKDGAELPEDMEEELKKSLLEEMMRRVHREHKYDKDDWLAESVKLSEADLADYNKLVDELGERILEDMKEILETDYEEGTIDKNMRPNSKHSKVTWQRAIPLEDHGLIYHSDSGQMKKQTAKLKRKIDLYGGTQKLTIRNQKRGRIDKRMLHRIPMGRVDLFKNTIIKTDNPLDVCILVDESGSMGAYTMREARRAAISLKEALSDNEKMQLWVFGHTADRETKGATEMTEYYSPSMKDRPLAMGGMRAKYENRDGTAIVASADRVKSQSHTPAVNKLMIILSDGDPSADRYRGKEAYDHTAACVKHVEARGWNVIQVGFAGSREATMKHCFKNWIYVQDESHLADKVSKIIRKVIKV